MIEYITNNAIGANDSAKISNNIEEAYRMVLHITTVDKGGAYKAVDRMRRAMAQYGIESQILVRNKVYQESDVSVYCSGFIKRLVSKGKNAINILFSEGQITRDLLGSHITKNRLVQEADVIIIHWINSFLSYQSLKEILRLHKPVVFFLHDMWLFTGGCHCNILSEEYCNRYTEGCGKCPMISLKDKDISKKNCKEKQRIFEKYACKIIGPSKWIVNCAENSYVLSGKDVNFLPNCYDDSVFYPQDNVDELKRKWNIDKKKTVLLFGTSYGADENENKGIRYLIEALTILPKEEFLILIFGESNVDSFREISQEYMRVGYISDENVMREIYNIADIFISPSKQESFGFTICEAMACGTPCVAFPVGGVKEQISHRENGYLAAIFDAYDIAKGIMFCKENKNYLGEQAAISAKKYSFHSVGKKYVEFIQGLSN